MFLIIVLFIFTQLWETTYSVTGKQTIAGYRLETLIWYLVFTEAIVMAFPRLLDKVEQEVKNGDIAYFLNRPLSYVGYHYSTFMAEAVLRVIVHLLVGGMLIFAIYGSIPWSLTSLPIGLLLTIGALTLQFFIMMSLSLGAFWIEEVRGYEIVYSKFVMILGGMMVPLDIFPGWLEQVARLLPFQNIVYTPASFAVGMASQSVGAAVSSQMLWILIFGSLTVFIYQMGVRRLHVNGG